MNLPEAIKMMLKAKPGEHYHAIEAMRVAMRAITDPPKNGKNGGTHA